MATNVVTVALGPDPINMTCPRCQANIQTAIDTETSGTGMALAICLCLVGLFIYLFFFNFPSHLSNFVNFVQNSRFCET